MKSGKVIQSAVVGAMLAAGIVLSGGLATAPTDCTAGTCPSIVMTDAALRSLIKG